MGINTLTPRYLNLDNDSRIIAAQEMVDALNVRVSADDGGDQGVVKNIAGNSVVGNGLGYSFVGSTNTIVGCYEHEATNRFFVFVHSSVGTHTVYELNQSDSSFTKIIESANITLTTTDLLNIDGMMIDEELHLYFTNGVDEPQKLNVDTSVAVGSYPSSVTEASVMKIAPSAPVVTYSTDSSRKSNELFGKSFQFALQYVYRDGEVSAIGEYSANTVGQNTLNEISDTESYKLRDNKIVVTLGGNTLGIGLGSTIPKVRLFFRSPADNTMFYAGEYDYAEIFAGVDFFNDKSYSVVSDLEFNKTQDNVPKSAQAQTITANRLFYANYKEGFDKADVTGTITPVYDSLTVSEIIPAETTIPSSTTTFQVDVNTSDVESKLNGTDSINTVVALDLRFAAKSKTTRTVTVYEPDGVTNYVTLQASDSLAATSGSETVIYVDSYNFFESHLINPTTSFSTYNTDLAAAINGGSITADINYAKAYFSDINWDTTLNFDDGSITLDVSAAATTSGVTITFTLNSFNISGGNVDRDNKFSFLLDKSLDYPFSLSDSFTSNSAIDVISEVRQLSNTSTYSVGSGLVGQRTFKNGDNHSFGVVFEDNFGRTTGVYEIGSVNVPQLSDRSFQERGRVSMDVDLSASNLDSDLVNYFYVYSGGNSIGDYVQYSVADSYVIDSTKSDESAENSIYLNLRTLQGKNDSYGATKDLSYSYKKGDKLRVISYEDSDGTRQYPTDVVFDIEKLETIEEDVFQHIATSNTEQRTRGQFVVIKDRDIDDWSRADVISGETSNFWGNNTIVELFSPTKEKDTKIYRAISTKYSVATELGQTQNLSEGNAWYKQRTILMPVGLNGSGNAWSVAPQIHFVESMQYSDSDASTNGELGGKPYAVINSEREHTRSSSITYSEPQFADSAQNYLSSFNASLANFKDFELNYGGIFGLCDLSDSIMVLQADKVSRVPVSRNILTTASGQDFVTQTTEILGLQQSYDGNFGINEDRQAFLRVGGDVYLVDVTRSKIVSLGSQGIKVLSDMNISSWLEERCDTMLGASSYSVSIGNDKKNSEVIFTLQDSDNNYIKSIVYSSGLGKFTSFVNYSSDFYGNLGNRFLQIRDNDVYEAETNSIYGHFFGLQYDAYIKAVFNQNPASRKVFNAIGVDGTANPSATLSTIDQSVSMPEGAFSLREGVYYGNVPREEGTSQFVMLGAVRSENDPEITFEAKVNRLPFRLGGEVFKLSGGVMTAIAGVTADSIVSSRVVSMSNAGAVTAGDVIGVKGASVDGDPLRGAYAEVKLDFNDATAFELFSITAHTSESGLHNNPQTQQ